MSSIKIAVLVNASSPELEAPEAGMWMDMYLPTSIFKEIKDYLTESFSNYCDTRVDIFGSIELLAPNTSLKNMIQGSKPFIDWMDNLETLHLDESVPLRAEHDGLYIQIDNPFTCSKNRANIAHGIYTFLENHDQLRALRESAINQLKEDYPMSRIYEGVRTGFEEILTEILTNSPEASFECIEGTFSSALDRAWEATHVNPEG